MKNKFYTLFALTVITCQLFAQNSGGSEKKEGTTGFGLGIMFGSYGLGLSLGKCISKLGKCIFNCQELI